jgi:hypothetical protein
MRIAGATTDSGIVPSGCAFPSARTANLPSTVRSAIAPRASEPEDALGATTSSA